MNFFKTVKEIKSKAGELHFKRFAIFESKLFSIYIHTIYKADSDKHLHNHPWNMTTCVLIGSYEETILTRGTRRYTIGMGYDGFSSSVDTQETVNTIFKGFRSYNAFNHFHKIKKLLSKKVVTIAFVGKRINQNWGYFVSGATIDSETYRKIKHEGKFNE